MYIGNLYPLCYQNLDNSDVLKPMFEKNNNSLYNSNISNNGSNIGDDRLYVLSRDLLIGLMKLLNQK